VLLLAAMDSKRGLSKSYLEAPAAKRFRENLSDLFLTNSLSSTRVGTLFVDAEASPINHL
jgi:hypothetical protein